MTGFDGVGNEQLMVERSSEGWGRQRRTVVREQEEEAHMEEIREGVVVKKEQLCKMKEEVEFGAGGSKKNKVVAKEGGVSKLCGSIHSRTTLPWKASPSQRILKRRAA